jgi:Tol biopolymer transport system component
MPMFSKTLIFATVLAAALAVQSAPGDDRADVLLQAAMKTETVDGDLKGAIKLYGVIATRYKSDRAVAAKALVHMAECYRKMGDAEARKIYERVVREYGDQKESVEKARAGLAASAEPAKSRALLANRRVWSGPQANFFGSPSPDGRYISYSDSSQALGIRNMETGESRVLLKKEVSGGVFLSVFSQDGRKIAFGSSKGSTMILSVVDHDGANLRTVYSNGEVEIIRPAAWSPDGTRILATFGKKDNTAQIVWVSVADGTAIPLKSFDWRYPEKVSLSPDGRFIVYDLAADDHSSQRDIFLLGADGSRESALVLHAANDSSPVWTPDGTRVLFVSDRRGTRGLWSIAVSEGKAGGAPELIKADVGRIQPMGFSRSGVYYYGNFAGLEDVYTTTLDPISGKTVGQPVPAGEHFIGANISPAWSPDGRTLAYLANRGIEVFGRSRNLILRSLKSGEERVLSLSIQYPYGLQWSPDSNALLMYGYGNRGAGYYRFDPRTGDLAPVIRADSQGVGPQSAIWSADGKALYYVRVDKPGMHCDLRRRDMATGEETVLYKGGKLEGINNLELSPDGRSLVFGWSKSHLFYTAHVMIVPASGGDPHEVLAVPDQLGELIKAVAWMPDGKRLLFSREGKASSELWRVAVENGSPEKIGIATEGEGLSVHPDGQHVAFTAGKFEPEVWALENFLPVVKR